MSIEQALAANTEAVEKLSQLLTDLYRQNIQNGLAEVAPCEVEAPPGRMVQDGKSMDAPAKAEVTKDAPPKGDGFPHTKDGMIAALMALFKATKSEEHTAEILKKFKVKSAHQVNESDYGEVIDLATAKLAELGNSK